MRLTDDRDDPQEARARRRRRAMVAVFLGAMGAGLFALVYAAQRLAVSYPAEDPRAWTDAAIADGVWQFRVGPMAEWLGREAAGEGVRGQVGALGSALHPDGALFVYDRGDGGTDWLAVFSVRRPLKVYHEPIDRLVRDLAAESPGDIVVRRDGRRLLVGSDEERIEAFRRRLIPRKAPEGGLPGASALSYRGAAARFPAAWRSAIGEAFPGVGALIECEDAELALLWPSPEPGPMCRLEVRAATECGEEAMSRAAQSTGGKLTVDGEGRLSLVLLAANVPPIWAPEEPVVLAGDGGQGSSP